MKNNLNKILTTILKVPEKYIDDLRELGKEVFIAETENGLPKKLSLDIIKKKFPKMSKESMTYIIFSYQNELIEHKIKSGAIEKNINKAKEYNKKALLKFIETGNL